ncbi:MAG TPA: hypothetical protein VI547_08070 [Anaerolineales bacterium]|nr:hypothetical protein [Anaerolineales bacterium]HLF01921.1 hypothetical protein [Anaerolineales bacterium]
MKHLQIAVITLIVVMVMVIVGALVLTGKVVLDGMGRDTTKLAFGNVNRAWVNGNLLETGKRLLTFSRVAVEGGMRWQMASYLLDRTERLKSEGQLSDAVDTCLEASRILESYDNDREVHADCRDLFWDERGY